MYIYIYIDSEIISLSLYIYIYTHIHIIVYIHIYIYIYIHKYLHIYILGARGSSKADAAAPRSEVAVIDLRAVPAPVGIAAAKTQPKLLSFALPTSVELSEANMDRPSTATFCLTGKNAERVFGCTMTVLQENEVEDGVGWYYISHEGTALRDDPSMGTDRSASLAFGTLVRVVEVLHNIEMQRVRARIEEPPGWISLKNTENGYQWASNTHKYIDNNITYKMTRSKQVSLYIYCYYYYY